MSLSKTFYELGDIEAIKKLLFNFDKIDVFDENDTHKNKSSQKSILSAILYNLENKKTVTYSFSNGKKSGRVYSKGGCQFLKRELRNTICNKHYYDLDIKNAQPTCLLWWCDSLGMKVETLKEYCDNREKYYHLKQEIINILYGASLPDIECVEDLEFLARFKKETKLIHNMMESRKEYSKLVSQIKKKQEKEIENKTRDYLNVAGSLCAEVLQGFENKCLQAALRFCDSKGIPITNFILMFDGFMIPIPLFYETLIAELNEWVLKETEIPAVFVKKEMNDIFKIPDDWIYDEKELKNKNVTEWYQREKMEFEKTICRIEQPLQYLQENTDNSIYLCNKQELGERCEEINYQGNFFVKMWCMDGKKRKYRKIDFLPPPKIAEPDVYNLWSGFEIEKADNPDTDNGITLFKRVVSVIAADNMEMETFIFNILAHLIQKPAQQLPISLVTVGLEGTGKNVFGDIIKLLIGKKYCFETADLENEVFCRFKYNIMNKLLLIINEADPVETFKYEQKLKNWIGNKKTQSFEGKGTKPIELEIYLFILLISNNMITPVSVTPTDRRYVITETSVKYRCDEQFWGGVVETFNCPENVKGVFNYLKNFNITVKNWSNERPYTKIYQRVKTMCFDKVIKGLRTLILDEWNYTDNTIWITNESIYKLCGITKEDESSFSIRLGQRNIVGICKKQKNSGRGWDINRTETYEWLKQHKFIFSDESMKTFNLFQDDDETVEIDNFSI